jgi:hypothetical protein
MICRKIESQLNKGDDKLPAMMFDKTELAEQPT